MIGETMTDSDNKKTISGEGLAGASGGVSSNGWGWEPLEDGKYVYSCPKCNGKKLEWRSDSYGENVHCLSCGSYCTLSQASAGASGGW